ncbi:MAG: DEAD/DEAH box helicase [bacterium]
MKLHGIWILEDEIVAKGKLFLWAEQLKPYLPTKPKKTNIHPYALPSKKILESIKISATSHQQVLLLPSYPAFPIPSSLMEIDDKPELKEWKVPGVVVNDDEILQFLILLDETELKEKKILLGEDILFLSKVVRFGIELLTRQRFIPYLKITEDKSLACLWQPVFINEEEKKLFSYLKDSMPDAIRCAVTKKSIPSKEKFILGFLTFLINHTIRNSITYNLSEFFVGEGYPAAQRKDDYLLDVARQDVIYSQFKDWSSPLKIKPQAKGFRTCFRLEPAKGNNEPWYLKFLFQAEDDPSLLIDVKDAWEKKNKVEKVGLKGDFHNRLLTDLGVAMRLFPQIERALNEPKPYALKIDTIEAYSFLQEASLLFKECGFGIFVPSFWDMQRKRGTQAGVMMKVAPSTSSSKFGLSQLIKFDWQIAVGDETIPKEEFEKLVKLKIPLVNIRGQWVELQPDAAEHILKYLKTNKEIPLNEFIRLSLGGGDKEGLLFAGFEAEGWLAELLEGLKGDVKIKEIPQPKDFIGTLRPYQIRGLSWMDYMNRFGLGVCLADDMGLGKTIQFIALLLHQKKQGITGPSLLVCPTSVMGNWERELAKFSPNLNVLLHHGHTRLKGKEFKKEAKNKDVIITSFSLIHRDKESLQNLDFRYIALDEAQNIKNPYTRQAQAARSIKADLKVALTGTPIENRLSELWSIMEFLNPGYLRGVTEFRKEFAIPIERYNDEEKANRLKKVISPFILRRLKTDPRIITDLPEKVEANTFCPLTKEQATLYQATVEDMMKKIESKEGIDRKGEVLALLMKLKQICNHPALFLHDRSKLESRSAKLERLKEMLEEVLEENDNALIFTQFAEMGKMIKDYLEDIFLCEVLFLYGGVSRKKREEMIARFQQEDGPRLFVLSLKAGGLGLNLTRANRVFHFDRWWNPAVENQATDRAFRIGQKKNVMVHKFICQGTVEERINELLEKKKGLAEKIVGAGENWITELSTKQLRQLFTLRKEAVMEE